MIVYNNTAILHWKNKSCQFRFHSDSSDGDFNHVVTYPETFPSMLSPSWAKEQASQGLQPLGISYSPLHLPPGE